MKSALPPILNVKEVGLNIRYINNHKINYHIETILLLIIQKLSKFMN